MKIVKKHKNCSAHSERFGIWSGKTLADIAIDINACQVSHGELGGQIVHIKIGNNDHDAFIWFEDMQEVMSLGKKLVRLADEAQKRSYKADECQ